MLLLLRQGNGKKKGPAMNGGRALAGGKHQASAAMVELFKGAYKGAGVDEDDEDDEEVRARLHTFFPLALCLTSSQKGVSHRASGAWWRCRETALYSSCLLKTAKPAVVSPAQQTPALSPRQGSDHVGDLC